MRSKWAINSAFMAFYGFAATLITWVLWAYKMGFGIYMLPFVGRPGPVVTMAQELGRSQLPSTSPVLYQNFPLSTMVYFQFVFAAITIVIMAGAFLGRMNFTAWMIFVPLWITFSYTIGAYSLWGGGFLFQMGVIDYSGGYVIHLSSGTAGFVGAHWIGPRLAADREDSRPNNILCVLIGAGILWIGWNGFNGGDPYAASADAGAAVLNTNVATAMSLLCWTVCDMIYFKKPSVIGAVQGMITGLVGITPCAGVVSGWGAICVGFATGTIPWASMNIMGKKVAYFRKIDDTLGIFHTHCVAGFVGGFCAGLFATIEGCAAFGLANLGGAIEGNGTQVWLQYVSPSLQHPIPKLTQQQSRRRTLHHRLEYRLDLGHPVLHQIRPPGAPPHERRTAPRRRRHDSRGSGICPWTVRSTRTTPGGALYQEERDGAGRVEYGRCYHGA
jgi:Amt family ammonium transporter